jgi:hypothetical protein
MPNVPRQPQVRLFRARSILAALVVAVVLVAVAALASGCGSSSTSATTSAAAAGGAGNGGRFAQYRACLQAHGFTLPSRPPGAPRGQGGGGPGGGLFGGGGGGGGLRGRFANNPAFQKAAQACGLPAGGLRVRRFQSPQARAALTKFVACVRQHGYSLPAPNFSGNAPVFDRTKVNTSDPRFVSATRACQADLAALRPPGGPGGPGAGVGGPPGTGTGG